MRMEDGMKKIAIPVFDLYGKEVSTGNYNDRMKNYAYRTRTLPKKSLCPYTIQTEISDNI